MISNPFAQQCDSPTCPPVFFQLRSNVLYILSCRLCPFPAYYAGVALLGEFVLAMFSRNASWVDGTTLPLISKYSLGRRSRRPVVLFIRFFLFRRDSWSIFGSFVFTKCFPYQTYSGMGYFQKQLNRVVQGFYSVHPRKGDEWEA